ncbi:haloacid dehalogenase type II [Aeromicrobium sp.]|uniref:haloacid dehalogenase type II n=1 Tax=Aeromicrobium sp. TaxID=1871063 RepID=UPI003C6B031D
MPRHPTPAMIVFDVNETLSDMGPLTEAFARVGLAPDERETWFAGLLRDGFALTSVGENPNFAELAAEALRIRLVSHMDDVAAATAVESVMGTFNDLETHPDVVTGIRALRAAGVRLVTLSNGSTAVASGLLERAGVLDDLESLMTVADGPAWKPAPGAYAHALGRCGVAAKDAMLVASHPWDIDGAARAGIRTAWLRRGAASYPSYFQSPEIEATDLADLAAAIT